MEGGTRMGSRSSTRHGPTSVFQGPVRRWRKSWTPVTAASSTHGSSRVLLYKWTPISASGNKEEGSEENGMRPVRYLPLSVVMKQKIPDDVKMADDKSEHDLKGSEAGDHGGVAPDDAKSSQELIDSDLEKISSNKSERPVSENHTSDDVVTKDVQKDNMECSNEKLEQDTEMSSKQADASDAAKQTEDANNENIERA